MLSLSTVDPSPDGMPKRVEPCRPQGSPIINKRVEVDSCPKRFGGDVRPGYLPMSIPTFGGVGFENEGHTSLSLAPLKVLDTVSRVTHDITLLTTVSSRSITRPRP